MPSSARRISCVAVKANPSFGGFGFARFRFWFSGMKRFAWLNCSIRYEILIKFSLIFDLFFWKIIKKIIESVVNGFDCTLNLICIKKFKGSWTKLSCFLVYVVYVRIFALITALHAIACSKWINGDFFLVNN